MTKALLATIVLVGSSFVVGCAEEPPTVAGTTTKSPASSSDRSPSAASSSTKSDGTTATTDRPAPADPTTTTGATTTTTTTPDKAVSPKDVQVKPIDPAKPEVPQIPVFACASESDSVTASYKIALLRAPDGDGLAFWTLEIQSGKETRLEVLQNIVRSDEFAKLRAPLTDEQFVNSLYTGFLARQPDADGKAFWLADLTNGASRTDVALAFVGSPEFSDPSSNKQAGCYF